MRTNWVKIKSGDAQISTDDKLRALLKVPYRLVLVQLHELEKLRNSSKKIDYDVRYIENLYKHYILENKEKTYLY